MVPQYDLDKIRFATDRATFERAVGLYKNGKVTDLKTTADGFSATVVGGNPYRVEISARHFDHGSCNCYLGQNDTLCKHMVAVALFAVKRGKPLTDEEEKSIEQPMCSEIKGVLKKKDLADIERRITEAMWHIKPYRGPSRTWFAYQNSLSEGCNRLSSIVSKLPVGEQTARLLVNMLLRLDRKLISGVDDSDGTVGGCIEAIVEVLKEYARIVPACIRVFAVLKNKDTCFGWEEQLVKLVG